MKTATMTIRDRVSAKARAKVTAIYKKALRDGTLVRPTVCSWCGDTTQPIDGHHPDYARPLMVVWICAPCHQAHHALYAPDRWLFHPSKRPGWNRRKAN